MAQVKFEHARVVGLAAVVPENCIWIDDDLELFNNDPDLLARNKKILGLGKRHVVDDKTSNADLCAAAAENLFRVADVDRGGIDALIVVSTSHDFHYPASACVLQDRLKLSENCTCYDISGLACSGYVHALFNAHALIASGAATKCLVLAGDLASTHSHRLNRNSNPLFGDAGTATLVEYCPEANPAWFVTGTRGKGWQSLIAPAGGYYLPIREDIAAMRLEDKNGNVWRMYDDIMDGMEIFRFSTEVAPENIKRILNFADKTVEDIDFFAFHQANRQIVRAIASYADLPKTKYSTETFREYGNCATAAVVLDLCRELASSKLNEVCIVTFGVGLSWGMAILNLGKTLRAPIDIYRTPAEAMDRRAKIDYWIDQFNNSIHGGK